MRRLEIVYFICLLFCFKSISLLGQNIIPHPNKLINKGGFLDLGKKVNIVQREASEEASLLKGYLLEDFNIVSQEKKKGQFKSITLKVEKNKENELGEEGYLLDVNDNGIVISAAARAGVFYGVQTLRQLIKRNDNSLTISIPRVYVEDRPRFKWRAFMLDEGRYFKGGKVVKKMLDEMALLKMNTFHWHLTEDQGWRIEIKKYPKLTEIGSKRDSTQIGSWPTGWKSNEFDGKPHSGYYTQEEIKDIIKYASARHITIIPEIEMPGHSTAAIAAYPWLGTDRTPQNVPVAFGGPMAVQKVLNVTDPKVRSFLHDVLDEVMALFPSKIIHIGGDEVKYDVWRNSSKVMSYMEEQGFPSPAALQVWFTNSISNYLASKGRRMMGWNEIMGKKLDAGADEKDHLVEDNLAPNTVVHVWKGDLNLAVQAAENGYDIVNSYYAHTYFDYDYKTIPLKKVYDFNPVPKGLDSKYHNKILGMGCQMWSEWVPDEEILGRQVFPRIAAAAEVGWTDSSSKNYEVFTKGLPYFFQRWDRLGITYYNPKKMTSNAN
ncbi:beta-N-acetylhexosaminidase [Echinicola marina]|uniref:beta-N-acetylhexosaminidase n=1 Tax=Echinicola marina TaxID=2859768 RepID=UPI001CF6369B|nr:beta-N-acetylhexosaminidase [Echinicola marina]UCS91656.1 beta-N-acetylhexosaminidase [Echinicola marina]